MVLPRTTLDKEPKRRNHDPINFHGTTRFILTKNGNRKQNSGKKNKRKSYLDANKVIYAAT